MAHGSVDLSVDEQTPWKMKTKQNKTNKQTKTFTIYGLQSVDNEYV